MFSSVENGANKNIQQVSWEQRLLKNAGRQKASLKPEYQELKFTLHRKLVDKINLEVLATIDNQRVRAEVRQAVIQLIDSEPTLLSSLEKQQISDEVLDEVFGLGPLEPLLTDPTISDILVNTYKQVYVERRGLLELTNVTFRDDQHLLRIIDKIVSQVGRRIDESTPMVDARLSDGSRVNAIISPLAVDGPLLSIRRFGRGADRSGPRRGRLPRTWPHGMVSHDSAQPQGPSRGPFRTQAGAGPAQRHLARSDRVGRIKHG